VFVSQPAIGTSCQPVITGTSAEPLGYRLGAKSGEGNNLLGWRGPNYNRRMLRGLTSMGRQISPPREPSGGDCEEHPGGRENLVTAGELKDEVGAEPEE
jgi:hypothetical protein